MLIANSETPALGFADAPVVERELELDEPDEELVLVPVSDDPEPDNADKLEPEFNVWAFVDADVRIVSTRTEQTLMAG